MNLFHRFTEHVRAAVENLAVAGVFPKPPDLARIVVEPPREAGHGDLATNAAMALAKDAGLKPRELAERIAAELAKLPEVTQTAVAGPGFINLTLDAAVWRAELAEAIAAGARYGRGDLGAGAKVNVEYVSANPTGPMHVGHCRGAVFGDALANLLAFAGYDVTREYYINDAGAQVDALARSAFLRYREALGETIGPIPEGLYPGDYLKPVGKLLTKFYGSKLKTLSENVWLPMVRATSIAEMMKQIRRDLRSLNVRHDQFFSERSLIEGRPKRLRPARTWTPELINAVELLRKKHPHFGATRLGPLVRDAGFTVSDRVVEQVIEFVIACKLVRPGRSPSNTPQDQVGASIEELRREGEVYEGRLPPPKGGPIDDYEDREQTLFRATAFGDDVDRPLKKSDRSYTYFASDIAYHKSKFDRGFRDMIDVWGADHSGYVKRMKAAVKAISAGQAELDVKIVQLVKLSRGGVEVKMSKRSGEFVTLRDVVDEVGRDAVRFMMLYRKNDAPLDFDLAKVIEQSKENPVFYVQYGHARGHSVFRNAAAVVADLPADAAARAAFLARASLSRLDDAAEIALMRKIAAYPRLVEAAAQAHEPHRVAFYLYELASEFHAQWTRGGELPHLRFIIQDDPELTIARLALVQGIVTVLASGLTLLGVEAPNEMR